jgi:prephenate dehydrogenase
LKGLKQITVIGLGLLGGSITLAVLRCLAGVKTVGYSHRAATRRKARELAVATEIVDDMKLSVSNSDVVILATPVCAFEEIFSIISDALPSGCIVTDVGSHPVAGSEQRGLEFARDDLFDRAGCILTVTKKTHTPSVRILKRFWSQLGCSVKLMTPAEHDKIFANISHLPHIAAAALINAGNSKSLRFAGKGFMDTSRIASGPANIWADVLLTNAKNCTASIDRITAELRKLKKAINSGDKKQIEKLLKMAKSKRAALIDYKMKKRELLS